MRTFFGLPLTTVCAREIADWRDRQLALDARPVPPANFHITLAFIGELRGDALERLCLAVDQWQGDHLPAGDTLTLDRVGYWQKTGIYWLGPSAWPDSLSRLASKLRGLASASGARRDRNRFQPHITLFRHCRTPPPAPASRSAIELTYDHFTLFESRQGRKGVSYHPLQDWELLPPVG